MAGATIRPPRGLYVVCYVGYAVVLALSYFVFVVWREVVALLVGMLLSYQSSSQAVYGLFVVLIGLGLFGLVMAAEPFLRKGVTRGDLRGRLAKVILPLAGAIIVGVAIQNVLTLVVGVTR